MQKYPNKGIFIGFRENSSLRIFLLQNLTAELIWLYSINMIHFVLGNFHHKKQKIMITNIFSLFSAYFSKTVGFGSVYSAEMNACYPLRVFLQDFGLFSENFRTGYSMAIFMLTAKKLIYTNLAIFGFFLSNNHDSFGFRKFCLKLIEKITKNRK